MQTRHLGVFDRDWVANRNNCSSADPECNPRLMDQPGHFHYPPLIQLSQTIQPGLIHQCSVLNEHGTHSSIHWVGLEFPIYPRILW